MTESKISSAHPILFHSRGGLIAILGTTAFISYFAFPVLPPWTVNVSLIAITIGWLIMGYDHALPKLRRLNT
jgi:hypothetical protein